MVPSILASSCELIVRVADLQDIINNQTEAAEVQTKLMEGQREVIEEQRRKIEEVTKTVDDQKTMIKHLTTGKTFVVFVNQVLRLTEFGYGQYSGFANISSALFILCKYDVVQISFFSILYQISKCFLAIADNINGYSKWQQ